MSNKIKYFLGSNTKRGFVSLFEEIRKPKEGNHFYILKGGPGSGKSFLMSKIAKTLEEKGHGLEYFPCASDPQSIDGIIDYDSKITIVDGTAPHTMDPVCPGAYDSIINMGENWNQDYLRENKYNIIDISRNKANSHNAATSCIKSAALILHQNMKISKEYINESAIHAWTKRLTNEISRGKNINRASPSWLGGEQKRLLSAVSVGGMVFFEDTIKTLCPKLYVIDDDFGSASNLLLNNLHKYAIDNNIHVITCYCSIRTPEKIDHLMFPDLQMGITTANSFHSINKDHTNPIYGLVNKMNKNTQNIIKRNLFSAKRLIQTAGNHISQAKRFHDDLEEYYGKAMDFNRADDIYDKMINEIVSFK